MTMESELGGGPRREKETGGEKAPGACALMYEDRLGTEIIAMRYQFEA